MERDSIRGARGEPGTVNARGHWDEDTADYQRYDTVVFRAENGYATFIYSDWNPGIKISPLPENTPGNPWQLWIYPGLKGDAATIEVGEVETLHAGEKAIVENVGTLYNAKFDMSLPGSPTVTVGSVKTVAPDMPAYVMNSGTVYAVVLDFALPQGEQGARGDQGIQGERGEQGIQGIQGERGEQGAQGPQGNHGAQGIRGERGEQGIQGESGVNVPLQNGFFRLEIRTDGNLWVISHSERPHGLRISDDGYLVMSF